MRVIGVVLGALVVVLLAAGGIAMLLVDPNGFRPRVVAALEHATGRMVAVGRISLVPGLPPTLAIADVSVANPPGGSRPQMAVVRRVEARLELWPLLTRRVVIDRLVLDHPDIVLERDAVGMPNWRFARQGGATASAATPPPGAGDVAAPETPAAIRSVVVRDGVLAWHGPDGRSLTLETPRLQAEQAADAAMVLSGDLRIDGVAFALAGRVGPLDRVLDRNAAAAWPVQATLTGSGSAGGTSLAVSGTLAGAPLGRDFDLVVEAAARDMAALAEPLGQVGLHPPPLHDVTVFGRIAAAGGASARLSGFKLHAGRSDLSAALPGLVLERADVSVAAPDDPARAEWHGTLAGAPFDFAGTIGQPWIRRAPLAIDLTGSLAGIALAAKGSIASPAALTGLDLALTGTMPDLARLATPVGIALPDLHDVAFAGHVADGPGGIRRAIMLTGLRLTAPPGDLGGDVTVLLGPAPKLAATLSSQTLDLDALLAPSAPAAPVASVTPPAPPAAAGLLDRTLPIAALRTGDADVTFSFATIHWRGVSYQNVAGHAVLSGGKLAIDPFAGQTPSGRVEASLTVDATQDAPPVALSLVAPGLTVRPVLALLGLPDDANGALGIDADLRGTGITPRALLSDLSGRLGLSMVGADIDNRTLIALVGDVLRAAKLPIDLGGSGRSRLRCFALRLNATPASAGQSGDTATIGALVLDTARLLLQGSGSVGLPDLDLALRLRPVVRLGAGSGFAVPVRVGGTLQHPKAALDAAGSLEAALTSTGLQGGRGVSPSGIDRDGDLCPPALLAARNGRPGPMPAGVPAQSAPAAKFNPADLLRGLVR